MTTNDLYRVPKSYAEPGKRMGDKGWYLVLSPEETLGQRITDLLTEIDRANPRSHRAQRLQGELDGVAYALALIQAGSSWFNGDEPRKLVRSYQAALYDCNAKENP